MRFFHLLPLLSVITLFACQKVDQESISFVEISSLQNNAYPFLSSGKDGQVLISWTEVDSNAFFQLKYASLAITQTGDLSIGETQIIASGEDWFFNWADFPAIAQNDAGEILGSFLVKSSPATFSYDVHLTLEDQQQTLKSWVLHDDSTHTEHGFVSIVPYQEHFFVAWLDGRETIPASDGSDHHHGQGAMTLRGTIIDREGNKTQEWLLDERVCDCCQTTATVVGNNILLAYRDRSDEEIRDIAFRRYDGQQWSDIKKVHDDQWKIAGCPVNGPKIASNGNLMAIGWFTGAEEYPKVYLQFSDDLGESFKGRLQLNEAPAYGRVGLVLANNGTAIASWMEQGAEGSKLRVQGIATDGEFVSPSLRLPINAGRSTGVPQLAQISEGKLAIAYTENRNSLQQIKLGLINF